MAYYGNSEGNNRIFLTVGKKVDCVPSSHNIAFVKNQVMTESAYKSTALAFRARW